MFQPLEVFGSQLRIDGPGHLRSGESRKLTVADLLALITGFGIVCVLPPFFNPAYAWYLIGVPVWLFVAISIVRLILWLNLAITSVIFVRRIQFGGMPRPAEWLAIFFTLSMFRQMIYNVDDVVNYLIRLTGSSHDYATWRWLLAGTGSLIVLIGFLFLSGCQNRLAPWLRLMVLSAMIFVLLWGPFPVFALQFSYLFPPLTVLGDGWTLWLTIATLHALAKLPYAILLGMPAVATYYTWRRGGRRSWTWTQWVAAGIATLMGFLWFLMFYFGSYESPPTGWISERIMTSVGLVITWFLCARLLRDSTIASDAASAGSQEASLFSSGPKAPALAGDG